jgi:hypothetical protein
MSTDAKKKKIESLRTSIANLETQLTLFKGNKQKTDAIQRTLDRFISDLKKLKQS